MSTLAEGMSPPWLTQEAADPSLRPFLDAPAALATPPAFEAFTESQEFPSSMNSTTSGPIEQAASKRGYTDGFLTARIFSLYSFSKLGFVGQYIQDSITTLGPAIIVPGTEDAYQDGFLCGLTDGEAVVGASLGSSR